MRCRLVGILLAMIVLAERGGVLLLSAKTVQRLRLQITIQQEHVGHGRSTVWRSRFRKVFESILWLVG